MNLSDALLCESKTARDQGLTELKSQSSEEQVLGKVKSLFFALWNGSNRTTREQVADFYEVPVTTIDSNYQNHRDEFEVDGVKSFKNKDLKELKGILPLSQNATQAVVYNPAGVLRMGFILRDSQVAKTVRTVAIQFIQGVGQRLNNEALFQQLTQSRSLLNSFAEGQKIKISAPLARYWDKMKTTLSRNYPQGGIPDFSKDDIRKKIQFLSTYTDELKLQGVRELRYEIANEFRGKYPDLVSDVFSFETDFGIKRSVIMFQFDKLIIDVDYVEECIGRGYLQIAKEALKVDNAYLIFVAPFGATSYAEDYIRKRLLSEYQGCLGVLTVKDLATLLYNYAVASRNLGTVKGEITSEFKPLLTYPFPDPPLIGDQLELDLNV